MVSSCYPRMLIYSHHEVRGGEVEDHRRDLESPSNVQKCVTKRKCPSRSVWVGGWIHPGAGRIYILDPPPERGSGREVHPSRGTSERRPSLPHRQGAGASLDLASSPF